MLLDNVFVAVVMFSFRSFIQNNRDCKIYNVMEDSGYI